MKNDDKIPILVNCNGKIVRIMQVIFDDDNSIYFTFPRKRGYKINGINVKEYLNVDYCEIVRTLDTDIELYINPKVSFHPRDMIVHTKTSSNVRVEDDFKVFNVLNDNEDFFYYCLQLVLPNDLNFFEDFNKTKYTNKYNISSLYDIDIIKKNYCIEICIHSSYIEPNESFLPYSKNRNLLCYVTIQAPKKYSVTLFISDGISSYDDSLLLNINSLDKSMIYTLK